MVLISLLGGTKFDVVEIPSHYYCVIGIVNECPTGLFSCIETSIIVAKTDIFSKDIQKNLLWSSRKVEHIMSSICFYYVIQLGFTLF